MLMGESRGVLIPTARTMHQPLRASKMASAAEDAACNGEPSQCCWNDAKVGQEGESDSEDNRYNACVESCESSFLIDVALHEPKSERCIFEGVFAK